MDFEQMAELATAITELSSQELRIMAHDLASLDPHMALTFATTILSALENRRQEVQTVSQPARITEPVVRPDFSADGWDYMYVDEEEDID